MRTRSDERGAGTTDPSLERDGMRRLAAVALTVLGATAIAYVLPGTERVRPWMPGDPPPMSRLWASWSGEALPEVPAFVTGGAGLPDPEPAERLARSLGPAVARSLAQSTAPPREASGGPAVLVEPSEYAGIAVEIEGRSHLSAFFRSLRATAEGRPGALTRIAHWGDSTIATDLVTYTLRRRLQRRFGDGGHGFVLVARGTMPYMHRDVLHRSGGDWELRQLVDGSDRDGRYGYGGVQFRSNAGAWASFGTVPDAPVGRAVSRFSIHYQRFPGGGRLRLSVDGRYAGDLETRGPVQDAVHVVEVPDGPHVLHLRALGATRLYGVALERDGPGVVYDSLGMVGARARRLLLFDPGHLAHQIATRAPDLLVLGFGGNEAEDPIGPIRAHYEGEMREVIRRVRAGRPDASCMLLAPLDQARRDERGRVVTFETVPLIVEAQRRAAAAEGCAFFDTFRAMGGEGAMARWSRTRPRLALTDFRHATPAGYEVIADLIYRALLSAFAEYLRAESGDA
ncbi:MAG: GDSL-type esterase/lipase family protein [Myxococcota bacterium]|nr:GDSL-type esterase/lipase family protein [Myxococcota bacterium]MDW8362874.1 GDSL-type esterase/lipase family protein [Myxococcales bacterium]